MDEMTFDKAFSLVVGSEGGFVNDQDDNGGATKYGVTIGTLSDWRGKSVTVDDVRNLSIDEAMSIYKKRYWDAMRCDDLPNWIRLLAFDSSINSGVKLASTWLQNAVGAKPDGSIGPVTLGMLSLSSPEKAIPDFMAQRLLLMAGHSDFKKFGKGWFRRVVLKILQGV